MATATQPPTQAPVPPAGPLAARDAADGRALGLVSGLLAWALLLHVLWWHGFAVASPWLAVVAAALLALARPRSVPRLAVLSVAAAVAILAELPSLGSHLLIVLVLACGVLAHAGGVAVRRHRLPSPSELGARVLPFLRAAAVVLYVAAAVSKLNATYFDAATSPARVLSGGVVWFAPHAFAPGWRVEPAIWGSVGLELALPVLLLVRRTRTAALVVGLTFHAILALCGTVPFTALMLVLYVGFLPGAVVGRLGSSRVPGVAAILGLAAWLALGAADVAPGLQTGSVLASVTRVLGAGSALLLAGAVARTVAAGRSRGRGVAGRRGGSDDEAERAESGRAGRASRGRAGGAGSGRPRGVYAVATLALVLCAASPYLGARTGDAFTMYSGLRVSERGWNSAVVPESVRVW